jgi:hypothetical protein
MQYGTNNYTISGYVGIIPSFLMEWHFLTIHHSFRFVCRQCSWSFLSKRDVLDHVKAYHTEKLHDCDYCDMGFTTEHGKSIHIG